MDKESLIISLKKDGYLKSPLIADAFRVIDRKDFIPESVQDSAYENIPLPIGFGQTISQPLTVAFFLELLELKKGEKVLDIGSGSGWLAALMAYLVSNEELKTGHVVSVERIPELKAFAEKNVARYENLRNVVSVVLGDGTSGFPDEAPYDKITASASAEEIPTAWKEQLKIGGRIVASVRDSIVVLDKVSKDEFNKKQHFGFNFVPLVKGLTN
jgi:protein-L-isoaspartate(D-aspartate) O-methyltransferase